MTVHLRYRDQLSVHAGLFFLLTMSTCSLRHGTEHQCTEQAAAEETTHQSAPLWIVSEQAAPRAAKSADRMEGAMMAGGVMTAYSR